MTGWITVWFLLRILPTATPTCSLLIFRTKQCPIPRHVPRGLLPYSRGQSWRRDAVVVHVVVTVVVSEFVYNVDDVNFLWAKQIVLVLRVSVIYFPLWPAFPNFQTLIGECNSAIGVHRAAP